MNMILSFLNAHRERLELTRYGVPEALTSLVLTPRFRASRHLVFLIMAQDDPRPLLVAKIPRLLETSDGLAREAENLRAVHRGHDGGLASAPRLVAHETYLGWPLLLETALVGPLMTPAFIRNERENACEAVVRWLLDVQHASCEPLVAAQLEQMIDTPLRRFADTFPLTTEEEHLLERTRTYVAPLFREDFWTVVEHGDLSHPNIMRLNAHDVGVVDWELAEACGIPAQDLFFFLAYAGFASFRARQSGDYIAAFKATFFGAEAWAMRYVQRYAEAFGLTKQQLTSLFLLCWPRYIIGLANRLLDGGTETGDRGSATADWLRSNRYFELWNYAVNHASELCWMRQ